MKTLRQRKDELIAELATKSNEVVVAHVPEVEDPTHDSLAKQFQNIFEKNRLSNPKILKEQIPRLVKVSKEKNLNGSNVTFAIYSNLKFLNLFRSRLVEEGIPLNHAESIMAFTDFEISEIPEDDDFVGDIALRYAELVKKHYDHKVSPNTKDLSDSLSKSLNPMTIRIPAE